MTAPPMDQYRCFGPPAHYSLSAQSLIGPIREPIANANPGVVGPTGIQDCVRPVILPRPSAHFPMAFARAFSPIAKRATLLMRSACPTPQA